MPTGPDGQKRPADVIANAVHVAKIATGEATEARTQPTQRETRQKARPPEPRPERGKESAGVPATA